MKLDKQKQSELGFNGGPVFGDAVMRYAAGAIKRERERISRIFADNGMKDIAAAILDPRKDDLVFKWNGPEVGLDVLPKSIEQRKAEKEAAAEDGTE